MRLPRVFLVGRLWFTTAWEVKITWVKKKAAVIVATLQTPKENIQIQMCGFTHCYMYKSGSLNEPKYEDHVWSCYLWDLLPDFSFERVFRRHWDVVWTWELDSIHESTQGYWTSGGMWREGRGCGPTTEKDTKQDAFNFSTGCCNHIRMRSTFQRWFPLPSFVFCACFWKCLCC